MILRIAIVLALCLSLAENAEAAQPSADSLLRAHGYPRSDSVAILAFLDAVYPQESAAPQTALQLYARAVEWSRRTGFWNGAGKGHNYSGIVWFNLGEMDSAIAEAQRSLPYFARAGNLRSQAASLNNIGNAYNVRNDYPQAIRYYQKANALYERLEDEPSIIFNLNNIGNMLVRSGNYGQGERYLKEAMERARKTGFVPGLADACNNLGSLEESRAHHAMALPYFVQALRLYQQTGESNFVVQGYSNAGWSAFLSGDAQKALVWLDSARAMLDTLELVRERVHVAVNRSHILNSLNHHREALKASEAVLSDAVNLGDLALEKRLREALAEGHARLGQSAEAIVHYRRLLELDKQIFDLEKNRQLLDLERKYESEKKERLILEQQLQLVQKTAQNRLLLILGAAVALLAGIVILAQRRRLRLEQRLSVQHAALQEQQMREMEQAHQLLALDAMVQGQEVERARIARDLHDGLGGLLASVKMHFSALERKIAEKAPGLQLAQKTGSLIDAASEEVRRIAYNLTPQILLREGLLPAIEEIAEGMRRGKRLQVNVQCIGLSTRLPEGLNTGLYRIIQELTQNILKHTNATKVIIQIQQHDGEISLLVEDNGQGFDPEARSEGLGLQSVTSRVHYLRGQLEIDSVPGEGTTVVVNVPLQ